jgi:hypothetical protein
MLSRFQRRLVIHQRNLLRGPLLNSPSGHAADPDKLAKADPANDWLTRSMRVDLPRCFVKLSTPLGVHGD